jgi:hypothetical protein
MTREELLKEQSDALQELLSRPWASRPWAAEERNAVLRATRGDMSVLAERIKSGEATDVERMAAADILVHPDDWKKHSFENMIDAERDREIANAVDFMAGRGEKKTNMVAWATKEYGISRSTIWERIKRGRLLLPRKVKAEDTHYLGRLEPDGDGGLKLIPPSPVKPSPVKTQK